MSENAARRLTALAVNAEQIGVDHTGTNSFGNAWTAVLAESELGEGEMKKVEAEGVPVLLVRHNCELHTIAHTAT